MEVMCACPMGTAKDFEPMQLSNVVVCCWEIVAMFGLKFCFRNLSKVRTNCSL